MLNKLKKTNKPYVRVAVGVILNAEGDVLLSSRPVDKPWPHWWELAGGKIEAHESVTDALKRELKEEIGITATTITPWIKYVHHYSVNIVELNFCKVTAWQGEPTPLEGQKVAWHRPGLAMSLDIGPVLPATFPVLRWLQLADRYLISTIGNGEKNQVTSWLEKLQNALENGVGLVQFREPAWAANATTAAAQEEIFSALQQTVYLCDQYGAYCLLNSVHPIQWLPHTDGLHLRSHDAATLVQQQQSAAIRADQLLAISTHNQLDLQNAAQLNSDFVVLGHVLPTPSHPDEPALGWEAFKTLANTAGRPVFAIGGQSADTLALAQKHGAHGIAGIRQIE